MRWLAVMVVGLAGLAQPDVAHACSCMEQTVSEAVTASHAIFTGKVTSVEPNTATRFGGLEVTLEVQKIWKGDHNEEIKVHTASNSAVCGYPFRKGMTYLVFAVRDEADPMRVSLCSRTKPIDDAKADIEYLGKPSREYGQSSTKKKRGSKDRCTVAPAHAEGSSFGLFALSLTGLAIVARRFC